jgi:hypothetical protein
MVRTAYLASLPLMKLFSLEASNLGAAVAKERAKSDEVAERRLSMGVSLKAGSRCVVFLNAGGGRGGRRRRRRRRRIGGGGAGGRGSFTKGKGVVVGGGVWGCCPRHRPSQSCGNGERERGPNVTEVKGGGGAEVCSRSITKKRFYFEVDERL